jgi:tetratricopeptide (TPR) repeat protein
MPETLLLNPFPGLRPFEPDEDHLFFGREKEIDDLLRRLRFNRFLAVTGTSGCGKSSLVRSGLLPSLQSGMMVQAGSSWRMAVMRPGEDPFGRLAEALDRADVFEHAADIEGTHRVMLEATLRRGTRGLIQAVRQAHMPEHENVLVLVDQFEELFRFRRSSDTGDSRDEAVAFVKLLLEAVTQTKLPIYVVLTMRSDFIGDCMDYPGLPEALNESQYLVPRMTRDELRSAITGPIAVADGEISPRLVLRLLNDIGDDRDDLPLLQHALMRTWEHWAAHAGNRPIDIPDYEAVGTLRASLSLHAEEAFSETGEAGQRTTELMFRALTDTFSDPRGVRRPTSIAELASICDVPEGEVMRIVDIFRRPGRSFLMPPANVPLTSRVIVDVSHESLLRCWSRLLTWAQAERQSAAIYVRLAREASWHAEGAAGLWDDPELELGLRWREANRPTAAWARRYADPFDQAMAFLDQSERERARQRAERRQARIRRLVIAWSTAAVLLVMSGILLVLFVTANNQREAATSERNRAEQNLRIAADAVDQLLVSIDRDPASIGADVPAMQQLRRELLERARPFYDQFLLQDPGDEVVSGMAQAHLRLGHINRMLNDPAAAAVEYERAIEAFGGLAARNPAETSYRRSLGAAQNWLGETLRLSPDTYQAADAAYGRAIELQKALVAQSPGDRTFSQDLARTHYNRGILYASDALPGDAGFRLAEAQFREAIRLLEPLVTEGAPARVSQDLARAVNNLGSLIAEDATREQEARQLYERATSLHETLVARDPDNRQYKLELAKFSNNLSALLGRMGRIDDAETWNTRALALLDDLARPALVLGVEQADAHTLRGDILESRGPVAALAEYRIALATFQDLAQQIEVVHLPDYHLRFGDLLINLGELSRQRPSLQGVQQLIDDAVRSYVSQGERALAAGLTGPAGAVVRNLSEVAAGLSPRDEKRVRALADDLARRLRERTAPGG